MTVYIDNILVSNQIGSGTLNSDGTFSVKATIPSTATGGQHTIYAATGGGQEAPHEVNLHLLPDLSTEVAVGAPQTVRARPAFNSNGVANGTTGDLPIGNLGLGDIRQQASTTITVVGAGQTVSPTIEIRGPNTGALDLLYAGSAYTILGHDFAKGRQVTISLDTAGGPIVAVVPVGDDGSFSATFKPTADQLGVRTLVATEVVHLATNPQVLHATDIVTIALLH